jgi:hypothetical protein
MEKLAKSIAKELETANWCAVYNPELARVWPRDGLRRQRQIANFAKEHGWRLGHFKEGFAAVFVEEPPKASGTDFATDPARDLSVSR